MAKAVYAIGILVVIAALIGIFIFYGKAYSPQGGSSRVTIIDKHSLYGLVVEW